MWGWRKQSNIMGMQLPKELGEPIRYPATVNTEKELVKQNHQLQKLLADSLRDSQALNQKLTDALDRVLVSKFDPPLKAQPQDQPNNGSLFPDASDVLSIEDDAAFIEKMEQLTK